MSEFEFKLSRRIWWLILPVLIGLLVILWSNQINSTQPQDLEIAEATLTLTITPTEEPGCLCGLYGFVAAWVDENGDGIQDPDEPPLPGVTIYVDQPGEDADHAWEAVTGWHGDAEVFTYTRTSTYECKYEIYPVVPEGYQLTTAPVLESEIRDSGKTYAFGFNYLAGVPTLPPKKSPAPVCVSYRIVENEKNQLNDLQAAPDGTVWAATIGEGVAQYFPDRDEWVHYTTEEGLVSDTVISIAVSDENVVWFGALGGISRYDDGEWASFLREGGLFFTQVNSVTIGNDGDVWFGTTGGVSRFNPSTGIWQSYTEEDGLRYFSVVGIAAMPDGSIWFSTDDGMSFFTDGIITSEVPDWIGSKLYIIIDYSIAPDGEVWIIDYHYGIFNLDLETEIAHNYDIDLATAIEVSWDGSIWIALYEENGDNLVLLRLFSPGDEEIPQVWDAYDIEHDQIIPENHLTDYDFPTALTISQDGALWIGTTVSATRCVFPDK